MGHLVDQLREAVENGDVIEIEQCKSRLEDFAKRLRSQADIAEE
jgi:hypothetical protein